MSKPWLDDMGGSVFFSFFLEAFFSSFSKIHNCYYLCDNKAQVYSHIIPQAFITAILGLSSYIWNQTASMLMWNLQCFLGHISFYFRSWQLPTCGHSIIPFFGNFSTFPFCYWTRCSCMHSKWLSILAWAWGALLEHQVIGIELA